MRYEINGSAIIHETLGDEVIIANLDSGIYYSLRGAGIVFWQLLIAGYSTNNILKMCQEKWDEDQTSAFEALVVQLIEGNLIRQSSMEQIPSTFEISWPETFSPPLFEKYEEMKDLLILDPIHEVDELGWPCVQK